MKKTIVFVLVIALAFIACDTGGGGKPEPEQPKPHESTITAFGKTIAVKGDASISTANFNTAEGKLGEAMNTTEGLLNDPNARNLYITMLSRTGFAMIIETGNAGPDADANKSMTIGVKYLLDNDVENTIVNAIYSKVCINEAFAD